MTHPLSASRALCLLGLSLTVLTARADADVKRPDVDTAALPAIAPGWADLNPLRGNAQAAAMALLQKTDLSAREITETALNIAGSICVFTNQNLTIEEEDCAE